MNSQGASISDERNGEIHDILFPNHSGHVSHIALDIGGSLIKVVYFTRRRDESGGRLNFTKFETTKIQNCISFLKTLFSGSKDDEDRIICATGGGAHKYYDLLRRELGIKVHKEDEMECLITGINFFIDHIPNEVFTYNEQGEMHFEEMSSELFPFLLVNIGSGVSLLKVTGHNSFERISGTSLGGGTFWGLMSLLEGEKSFDEILEMTRHGDNSKVDMLVGDIYGTDYNKIGLKATTIASSMGKVFRKPLSKAYNHADVARSLLFMISNNIGQIAYLNAKIHGLTRIYFGGYFIRGHPVTMSTLSYAIKFWSKGTARAFFLRHEGYLGAVGAFMKHQDNQVKSTFSENFTVTTKITEDSVSAMGTLDSKPNGLAPLPKLKDIRSYVPDTFSLADPEDQKYWTSAVERNLNSIAQLAMEWGSDNREDAKKRIDGFTGVFRKHLAELRANPGIYGSLTVRSLLDLREKCLYEFGLHDIFRSVKGREVDTALASFPGVIAGLDAITNESELLRILINNVLAGNMFDWGSSQTMQLLRNDELVFETAGKLVKYASPFYQPEPFIERMRTGPAYQMAVIFVDNSGPDIVLGIIPFARYLLRKGTRVILAANTIPALNDITASELTKIIGQITKLDQHLRQAWTEGRLMVIGTGNDSPCLDLRRLNTDLARRCQDVDLVVIEGMGRAIHSNYYAEFSCDSLKLAVFKNAWAAKTLGAEMYSALCRFEQPKRIPARQGKNK